MLFLTFSFLINSISAQVWTQKTDLPDSARRNTTGFTLKGNGYICLGGVSSTAGTLHYSDLYQYNQQSDSWLSKASFPGLARRGGISFTTDSFAYVGLGWDNTTNYYDIHRYNPITNSWDSATSYPGNASRECFTTSVNGKAYVGGGVVGTQTFYSDFWEFDLNTNIWTQKADFPMAFGNRSSGVSFEANGKLYFGLGSSGSMVVHKDLWEYDISTNSWTKKADFPGLARVSPVYFKLNGKLIVGGGTGGVSSQSYDDYYEYNISNNTWALIGNFPIANISRGAYFDLNGKAYVATGFKNAVNSKELIEFDPASTGLKVFNLENTIEVSIFPNPSKGDLIIEIANKKIKIASFQLFDVQGKLISENQLNNSIQNSIDISELKSGLYTFKITSKTGSATGKIVKY